MPGISRVSIDNLGADVHKAYDLGIQAILLFGIPESKDSLGSDSYNPNGIIQLAIKEIRQNLPDILIITDVCMCEYTDHGHCGITERGSVNNDKTLDILAKISVSHVQAGSDIVAPSAMMDGMINIVRNHLDSAGYEQIPIMSYAVKYASAFYGPFRNAVDSTPQQGDRKSYQMDPANSDEAIREVAQDIEEGADMVMVKPGMPYLDIVQRVKDTFGLPTFAYQVSGEYAMLKGAVNNGWLENDKVVIESLISFKRAGADGILTYMAVEASKLLNMK